MLALRPVDPRDTAALAQSLLGRLVSSTEREATLVEHSGATNTLLELGTSIAPQGPHNHADTALAWHGPAAGKVLFNEAIDIAKRIHVRA
jgi:hypothetical protein